MKPENSADLKNTVVVASLNYSGVLTSPYQYFENEQQTLISDRFMKIVSQDYKLFEQGEGFSWDMASIDTKWKNRYTPVSNIQVGVENGVLLNKEQFLKKWDQLKQETIGFIKKQYFEKKYKGQEIQKRMQIQISKTRQFDLYCYKTLLSCYCDIQLDTVNNVSLKKPEKASQYIKKKQPLFAKPFLNEAIKSKKTLDCIKKTKHDIIFFQEANKLLIQKLKQQATDYHVWHNAGSDSIILVRKKFCQDPHIDFAKKNKEFLERYQSQLKKKKVDISIKQIEDKLNFNKDSIFLFFQNYLFVNAHISSQKDKNEEQLIYANNQIKQICQTLPGINLIFGGDFNSNIDLQIVNEKKLSIIPADKKTISVKKKRTFMQPQRNKANKLDESLKDFIISNLKVVKGQVILINGKPIKDELLPNSEHPYDHFMILAEFLKPKANK